MHNLSILNGFFDNNNFNKTQNNFINAFLNSYNFHLTLKIRPNDIKLQILTIISICVNNNPEKFRSYFVDHQGKKELLVDSPYFSADYFCETFARLLHENIKDKEFARHYSTKFTTSNQIISTVNNITLMNTLKEYFSFSMVLSCGIPEVILEGVDEDWKQLNESYQFFKIIFGETELKDWFRHFDKVMELFMMMREVQINDDMKYITEMWKRVISYIPQGSGGDQILGGWIRLFVPYNGSNKPIRGLDKEIPCMNLIMNGPTNENYYAWQDEMKQFYLGADWDEMFTSFISTPAKLVDEYNTEHNVEFYSGFYPPHLSESGEVCMNIGYLMRENQQIKKDKLKKMYIEKGVEYKNSGFLKIPKWLQKESETILDAFGAFGYSFYGKDPEEEKRKQYFIDEGVKLEKNNYGHKCLVPNKLKDEFKNDIEKIRCFQEEIRKLFSIYKIEYYDL